MHKTLTIVRRATLYIFAFVLAAGYPFTAMADTQEPTTDTSTQVVPTTTETAPAEAQEPEHTYTFDPTTQRWNSEEWQYNPQTDIYEEIVQAPVVIEPTSDAPGVSDATTQSTDKDINTTVQLDNEVDSTAASGDSTVSANTLAGNAITGDAEAMATLINVVNSTIGTGGNQKVATFTQDILGDVKGDIILYPMLLKAMLEANAPQNTDTTHINASVDLAIDNTIGLTATSGDAAVVGNTTGGDATSGSASAVANVVNILNSMIAAQDSFIGTINIYGNLEGDILIAPDFIPQMLANNSTTTGGDTKISQQDTTTIVNNISAVAESGAAEVFGNTAAGDATSGDASSNVVIFNVTGHEVIAKNSLLVFVNVLGKWVGMIVDAPQDATAAMIGNGVTTSATYAPDLTLEADSTHGITNTIAVTAQSGDATVSHNTNGGSATSGQARALANIANVSGSQFGISDWFGVLFINVFQSWYGDFGINTPYGDTVTEPSLKPEGPIQFIPTATTQPKQNNSQLTVIDSRMVRGMTPDEEMQSAQSLLASSPAVQGIRDVQTEGAKPFRSDVPSYDFRLFIIAGSVFLIGASALGLRRLLRQ